jgi:hypothetical protein
VADKNHHSRYAVVDSTNIVDLDLGKTVLVLKDVAQSNEIMRRLNCDDMSTTFLANHLHEMGYPMAARVLIRESGGSLLDDEE